MPQESEEIKNILYENFYYFQKFEKQNKKRVVKHLKKSEVGMNKKAVS